MEISLLDMGHTKYGDCILVTRGNRRILIDGAHPGDQERIKGQLRRLLNQAPPFHFDLLVITHCHADHIGCLPRLIEDGDLTAEFALVADERLGWGRTSRGDDAADADLSSVQRKLLAALLEEPFDDLPDAEIARMLEDAALLEDTYADALAGLAANNTQIVRYGRDRTARVREIENQFQDFGLKILGPSRDHLVVCAEEIQQLTRRVHDGLPAADEADDPAALAAAYRALVRREARRGADLFEDTALEDRAGVGAAKNDQSIVLRFEADGWSALLAGDMQFAAAEVPDLADDMHRLRRVVRENGPYDFIKLSHHTSYNGFDESLLEEWRPTALYAHTGGSRDAGHPDRNVLQLLKAHRQELRLARTDRNGIVTVANQGAAVRMTVERGRLNNFTPNRPPDTGMPAVTTIVEHGGQPGSIAATAADGTVEVIARIPHRSTKVTLTIQIEPDEQTSGDAPSDRRGPAALRDIQLGGGRSLPQLLFVTQPERLSRNIGRAEAAAVIQAIRRARQTVATLPDTAADAESASSVVRSQLERGDFEGVVVVGGLDVVPAQRLDVLDRALRQRVNQALRNAGTRGDSDQFIVWSDDIYGDRDGDRLPELPTTRIPDGRMARTLTSAIQAQPTARSVRAGVRNLDRPFAEQVFPGVPGDAGELLVSEPASPRTIRRDSLSGYVYFMLHGTDTDPRRFWGEDEGGELCEAVDVTCVPSAAAGSIVFCGCCWGALTAQPRASQFARDMPLRPNSAENSIALAYLQAGALAVVGCTGTHYSPLEAPFNYFGQPMHAAFWDAIRRGEPPAQALFTAKKKYVAGLPHGRRDPFSLAVELKILRQYTCLGLGW